MYQEALCVSVYGLSHSDIYDVPLLHMSVDSDVWSPCVNTSARFCLSCSAFCQVFFYRYNFVDNDMCLWYSFTRGKLEYELCLVFILTFYWTEWVWMSFCMQSSSIVCQINCRVSGPLLVVLRVLPCRKQRTPLGSKYAYPIYTRRLKFVKRAWLKRSLCALDFPHWCLISGKTCESVYSKSSSGEGAYYTGKK